MIILSGLVPLETKNVSVDPGARSPDLQICGSSFLAESHFLENQLGGKPCRVRSKKAGLLAEMLHKHDMWAVVVVVRL